MVKGYTDERGEVAFTVEEGESSWTAEKGGYVKVRGRVLIDRDITVEISLETISYRGLISPIAFMGLGVIMISQLRE